MSAIANFKKRRLAEKDKGETTGNAKISITPEKEALILLSTLLNVTTENAIAEANKYVENNIRFFEKLQFDDEGKIIGFDPAAPGEDKTAVAEVTLDEKGNIENIDVSPVEDETDELNESINTASNAAGEIENAADKASDAASDLAYQADDINAANSDLKETVEELKKPSAAQESSNSKSKTKQKNSSKK
ncbi:hypothetical protein [Pseudoalteromonas sp. S1608]|uniref:hypothetical protein n=1 Tax=Pseudoalteromonas sp. S1608 TaxID=579504 RepID=UPI00110B8120|nr:hypothetical protein [Pseudoalteromonas sp. S1608]TMP73524.1 hypothetical protein CWB75_14195 [Pseudoalteromonas sp. S1608]